jgi:hypothetical protein
MIIPILILLIAVCSLAETRRREKQITERFIERGKQQIPESLETTRQDEQSLRSALHGSRIGLWFAVVFSILDLIGRLFAHE